MRDYPTINCHCHLLNFAFIPNAMFKLMAHNVDENLVHKRWMQDLIAHVTHTVPGNPGDRLPETLRLYNQDIKAIAADYLAKMERAGIDIAVPLMMDLETCFGPEFKPERHEEYVSYADGDNSQVAQISAVAAKYPWQIFPFIMFDPGRKGAVELCIDALENRGFLGIKMYPPLGYFPSCDAPEQDPALNRELERMYAYCQAHRIPITTHCSTSGAFKADLKSPRFVPFDHSSTDLETLRSNPMDPVWERTDPANWADTVFTFGLKLNFAHFGGNYFGSPLHPEEAKLRTSWRSQILTWLSSEVLGLTPEAQEARAQVFADVAFHDFALQGPHQRKYFDDLTALLGAGRNARYRILFGTDASMTSHTWTEEEYIAPFREHLNEEAQRLLFFANPRDFLFGPEGRVPERYLRFLRNNATDKDPFSEEGLKPWVRREGAAYFIGPRSV